MATFIERLHRLTDRNGTAISPTEPRPTPPPMVEPLEARLLLSADIVMPTGSGVINVTNWNANPALNATPNDGLDDTAALQAAIESALGGNWRYAKPRMVYLPTGQYDVSDTLVSRLADHSWSDGWRAGMVLVGESQTGTVLHLMDTATGFDSASSPKAVIKTGSEGFSSNEGGGGPQAFRHQIINLTVDVGNHSGAIGIDYQASNRGTIEDVTIIGEGLDGLRMTRHNGPALVKNLTVNGFDYGIRVDGAQYGTTFENITVQNQDVVGLASNQHPLFIRGFVSDNSVRGMQLTTDWLSQAVLIDAAFTGGASGAEAIYSQGGLLVRNLDSSGYGTVINNTAGADVAGGAGTTHVEEFASHAVDQLNPGPAATLNLQVKQTPTYSSTNMAQWISVSDALYGATAGDSSNDDAVGIQAAIDDAASRGATVVYLPWGTYHVDQPIYLRGGVRKIVGFESNIVKKSSYAGNDEIVIFDGTAGQTIVMEHLQVDGVLHSGAGTLSVRHADIQGYRNDAQGTGDMFLEDVIVKPVVVDHPQHLWARQINPEVDNYNPRIINRGGTMWLMGVKLEGESTVLLNEGGDVELLGAFVYQRSTPPADQAAFINDEGNVSLSFTMRHVTAFYNVYVRERRDGVWSELLRSDPSRDRGSVLYTGYVESGPAPGALDFDTYTITGYDTAVNGDGIGGDATVASALDGGATLKLEGNAWKRVNVPYTVTGNTYLEFDFLSDSPAGQGEIHALAFATSSDSSADDIAGDALKLWGTQSWGDSSLVTYAGSGWQHVKVRAADFAALGSYDSLVFVNDDDAPSGSNLNSYANGSFRNVMLYEDTPQTGVLLSDNFDDGDLNGWTVVDEGTVDGPSDWTVTGGEARQASNIHDGSTAASRVGTYAHWNTAAAQNWSNYTVSMDIRSTDDDGLGIMLYYQDPDNYYRFEMDKQRNFRRLIKKVNGAVTLLASTTGGYYQNTTYNLTATIENGQITIVRNGVTEFGGAVADNALTSGSVALYSWGNSSSYYDNITVTSLSPAPSMSDNFDDGDLNGWTVVDEGTVDGPSNWTVTGGEARQSSNINDGSTAASRVGTYAYWNDAAAQNWNNYTISMDVRSTDDDGIGIMFCYQDSDNYYRFEMDKQRNFRRLIKKVNGVVTLLASTTGGYYLNTTYDLSATIVNGQITIVRNGTTEFGGAVSDNALTSGSVAMYSWGNGSSYFDNVQVASAAG